MLAQFWAEPIPAVGAVADIAGAEAHHAVVVSRVRVGAQVRLADGAGTVATARVVTAERTALRAEILTRHQVPLPEPRVVVVQALPKSERAELAVDLATEAGADEIVPWAAARCVAKWSGPKAVKGQEKWHATAVAAAKQSRRARIPTIAPLATTAAVTALIGQVDEALVLHQDAAEPLAATTFAGVRSIALIIGPEGGLTADEIAAFVAAGARPVVLGPQVLRTATAAAVALGALGVLTGRWSPPPHPPQPSLDLR